MKNVYTIRAGDRNCKTVCKLDHYMDLRGLFCCLLTQYGSSMIGMGVAYPPFKWNARLQSFKARRKVVIQVLMEQ